MQTRLTLHIEQELIKQAKMLAHQQNKTLSQLVEEYFRHLTSSATGDEFKSSDEWPPITQSLIGILQRSTIDENDYQTYLGAKHL